MLDLAAACRPAEKHSFARGTSADPGHRQGDIRSKGSADHTHTVAGYSKAYLLTAAASRQRVANQHTAESSIAWLGRSGRYTDETGFYDQPYLV